MSSQCSPDPEPGSSTGPGVFGVPASGPNGTEREAQGVAGAPVGGPAGPPDPGADSPLLWADIWRDALQAGLASMRREPDSGDER